MTWWKFWEREEEPARREPDYYTEGLNLARQELYHEALTSFRLALREEPGDVASLEQMAVIYTRMERDDEAIRMYQRALEQDPERASAHYGVGFLLLKRNREQEAAEHLRTFLEAPAGEQGEDRHVRHAETTLARLREQSEGEGIGE